MLMGNMECMNKDVSWELALGLNNCSHLRPRNQTSYFTKLVSNLINKNIRLKENYLSKRTLSEQNQKCKLTSPTEGWCRPGLTKLDRQKQEQVEQAQHKHSAAAVTWFLRKPTDNSNCLPDNFCLLPQGQTTVLESFWPEGEKSNSRQ